MPRRPRTRRPARRPRRRNARKGKASANTKVDLYASYKQDTAWSLSGATSPPTDGANYGYTTYSPFNASTQNITQNSEFQAQKMLYDEFCITSVKISWVPNTNTVLSTAAWPNSATTNMLYTFVDRDGGSPVITAVNIPAKIEAYDSFKKHSVLKPWSRTITCSKMWMDCSTASINPRSESGLAQNYTNAGLFQVLGVYGEKLPFAVGQQVGTVRQEWRIQFRGKKPVSYTVLPDGVSVVMTPVEAFGNEIVAQNAPGEIEPPLYDTLVDCSGGDVYVVSRKDGTIVPPAGGWSE